MKRALCQLIVTAALFVAAASGAATVAELARQLAHHEDFRVRTQAALALGASGDAKAVTPLCGGLNDPSDTVRAAAAAALGKLALGGADCLKQRLGQESDRNVKKMIEKAIVLVEEAAAGPALTDATRYYIAIDKVAASGARDADALGAAVRASLKRTASALRGYVFAPENETAVQAKKRLRQHPNVVGYLFAPTIRIERQGTDLTVQIDLELFDYPDKAPVGSLTRQAGIRGAGAGPDADQENKLVDQVVSEAMKEFDKMAAQAN